MAMNDSNWTPIKRRFIITGCGAKMSGFQSIKVELRFSD
jgi:hypothetical protein